MNEMNKFPLMGMMRMEEACQDKISTKKCLNLKKMRRFCNSKKAEMYCKKTCDICDDGQGRFTRVNPSWVFTSQAWQVLARVKRAEKLEILIFPNISGKYFYISWKKVKGGQMPNAISTGTFWKPKTISKVWIWHSLPQFQFYIQLVYTLRCQLNLKMLIEWTHLFSA